MKKKKKKDKFTNFGPEPTSRRQCQTTDLKLHRTIRKLHRFIYFCFFCLAEKVFLEHHDCQYPLMASNSLIHKVKSLIVRKMDFRKFVKK